VITSKLAPKIIFQDAFFLVLDKPAGMVVNQTGLVRKTIQSWLKGYFRIRGEGIGKRAGIVHRLDKETSGLLLVAKTKKAFQNLQEQFRKRKVEKSYLALVHGKVSSRKGTVEVPLGRIPKNKKKMGVFLGGRQAQTRYLVKKGYQKDSQIFSLLLLQPTTGRTHQIRVHLKFIGHSVVGDKTYAGRKTARQDRVWCPRQFLHASQISFVHPEAGKRIEFHSPLPEDLGKALKNLIESS